MRKSREALRTVVSATELVRRFADYLNRVAYRRERFVVRRGGKDIAELAPLAVGRRLSELPDLLAGLPRLGDADAADFAADLETARAELETPGPVDRWAS